MWVHTCSVTLVEKKPRTFISWKTWMTEGRDRERKPWQRGFFLPSIIPTNVYIPSAAVVATVPPAVQMLSLCLPQVEAAGNEGAVQLQRGMLPRMSTVGEHMTRASQPRYKYYYSISQCRSELWNLTPPFLDDLDYATQTLLVKAVNPREGGGMLGTCRQSLQVFSALVKVELEL